MQRDLLYKNIVNSLRVLQKRNSFVLSAYGSQFSLSEAHIIVEVSIDPYRSAKHLSSLIGLEKSTIVRALNSLIRRGYLQSLAFKKDARKRELVLTPKGMKALAELDKRANSNVSQFSANLTHAEQERLCMYLRLLADKCGAHASILRAGELPLRLEVRRLTRAFGLLGNTFMESGISSTYWQILSEIEQSPNPITSTDLCEELNLSRPSMSQSVNRLETLGIIQRLRNAKDKRGFSIMLTEHGQQTLHTINSKAAKKLDSAFLKFSFNKLKDFDALFFAYSHGAKFAKGVIQEQLQVRCLTSEEERTGARSFLMLQLIRQNNHTKAPEILIGQASAVFGLYQDKVLRGICELQPNKRQWVVANFVTSADLDESDSARNFLSQSLKLFSRGNGRLYKIKIPDNSQAAKLYGAQQP